MNVEDDPGIVSRRRGRTVEYLGSLESDSTRSCRTGDIGGSWQKFSRSGRTIADRGGVGGGTGFDRENVRARARNDGLRATSTGLTGLVGLATSLVAEVGRGGNVDGLVRNPNADAERGRLLLRICSGDRSVDGTGLGARLLVDRDEIAEVEREIKL